MYLLFLAGLLFLVANASTAQQPRSPQHVQLVSHHRSIATIKEIMDSMIDPSANALWASVASHARFNHIEEKAPRSDREWRELRRSAMTLLAATDMLLSPGRHVAKPGDKSANPRIELEPEQIEKLINEDRIAWVTLARGLHDSTVLALHAIDNKDVLALQSSGNAINEACERCHQRYWYPNRKKVLQEQQR